MAPPLVPKIDLSSITAKQKALPRTPSSPAPSPKDPSSPSASTLKRIDFNYLKGELVGNGAYGSVHVAINNTTGEIMAMKEFQNISKGSLALRVFEKEIAIVSKLRHPHVVGYLGMDVLSGVGGAGSFR